MKEHAYPEGVDCVWLATDRDARVAAFVTGGAGPIPVSVLDVSRPPVEEIEARINEIKPVTSAQLLVNLKRPDDFVGFAKRGLFAYDWTDVHRTRGESLHAYELIAIPGSPISIRDLPNDLADLVAEVSLNVSFNMEERIDVCRHLICVPARVD